MSSLQQTMCVCVCYRDHQKDVGGLVQSFSLGKAGIPLVHIKWAIEPTVCRCVCVCRRAGERWFQTEPSP